MYHSFMSLDTQQEGSISQIKLCEFLMTLKDSPKSVDEMVAWCLSIAQDKGPTENVDFGNFITWYDRRTSESESSGLPHSHGRHGHSKCCAEDGVHSADESYHLESGWGNGLADPEGLAPQSEGSGSGQAIGEPFAATLAATPAAEPRLRAPTNVAVAPAAAAADDHFFEESLVLVSEVISIEYDTLPLPAHNSCNRIATELRHRM